MQYIILFLLMAGGFTISQAHNLDFIDTVFFIVLVGIAPYGASHVFMRWIKPNYEALLFWDHHQDKSGPLLLGLMAAATFIVYKVAPIPTLRTTSPDFAPIARFGAAMIYAQPVTVLAGVVLSYIPPVRSWMEGIVRGRSAVLADADKSQWTPGGGKTGEEPALDFDPKRFKKD